MFILSCLRLRELRIRERKGKGKELEEVVGDGGIGKREVAYPNLFADSTHSYHFLWFSSLHSPLPRFLSASATKVSNLYTYISHPKLSL
ncbi:hypothetical protein VNO77_12179 [Canavalia gladiata]|uniref:Uncharacterized protein n=1 Tax=Canavalia gladiata TaxID=3824 RepID=A0AAN9LZJ7_CANGL